jgi:hypothetical protein
VPESMLEDARALLRPAEDAIPDPEESEQLL